MRINNKPKQQMRHRHLALITLLSLLMTGCGSLKKHMVSEAITADNYELNNYELNKYGSLELQNAEIQIRPMNRLNVASGIMLTFPLPPLYYLTKIAPTDYYHYSSYYEFRASNPPDHFVVEMLISPGNTSLMVDLSKVALSIGTKKHFPSSVKGPFEIVRGQVFGIRIKRRDFSQLCNPNKVLGESTDLTNISIPKDARLCFALTYDTSALSPNMAFAIHVESIVQNHIKQAIPAVNFRLETSVELSN